MCVPNTRKVVAVRDVIIKESEVGSIPVNTETPNLLDQGSRELGTWHQDVGHQENGNKEEQGTSTAIKGGAAWHREREHSRNDTETKCLGC